MTIFARPVLQHWHLRVAVEAARKGAVGLEDLDTGWDASLGGNAIRSFGALR